MDVRPFWLAGRPATGEDEITVTNPYDGRVVGAAAVPTPEQVERAVAAADAVRRTAAALPVHVRAEALAHVSRRLAERAAEVAELISAENGKPIMWARAEVSRAVSTFRFGAEEARRLGGEMMRLDTEPAGEGRVALVTRQPYGPVLGITPFNFPLNLVAHKVAPAIAVGAPVIIKP
ncbi:MAG: aldehyde dehydrogenase family protein, partial [Actinomycetes bacterium]